MRGIINIRKLTILAALALVAGLLALGVEGQATASHTSPGTLYVAPSGSGGGSCSTPDFNSIQAAVNHAGSGDTINVCPGTYTEDLSITTNDLELVGLSSSPGPTIEGVDVVAGTLFPLADPNIDIQANGVSIHGFTIKSPVVGTNLSCPLTALPCFEYSSGIVLTGTDIEIYDNDFLVGTGDVSQGIQTWALDNAPAGLRDISGLSIHDNTFTHLGPTTGVGLYEGIYINPQSDIFDETDPADAVTIEDNAFSGELIRAITTERSQTVIDGNTMSSDSGTVLNTFPRGIQLQDGDHHSVTDNTIDDSGSGAFYWGILVRATDSAIGGSGNEVTGAASHGILLQAGADDNTVAYNNVNSNGGDGILVESDDNDIHNNAANHNGVNGIEVTAAGTGNTLTHNEASHNTLDGIHVDGNDSDLFGNNAHHNGQDGIVQHGDGDCPTTGPQRNKAKFNENYDFAGSC